MEVAAFHPHPFDRMRLVSVALFLAFPAARADALQRLGVTQHPALRSPDFPLPANGLPRPAATVWLTSNCYFITAPSDTRQLSDSPAWSGTTVVSPNAYSAGTVQVSRRSVTVSRFRG